MKHLYGDFQDEQFEGYLQRLHKKLFWLILYKDPQTMEKYNTIDFDVYFQNLMKEINGLNELLFYPTEIVEIMALLQAAFNEVRSPQYSWQVYRKFVLDAHALVDRIKGVSQ